MENPQLSESPLSRDPSPTLRFPYQASRKSLFVFTLPRKLGQTLDIAFIIGFLGLFLSSLRTNPDFFWLILAVMNAWSVFRNRNAVAPNEVVIEADQLSLQPAAKNPSGISFSDVRIYEESVSHIDIYHEQISGLSKFRFLRHEFLAPDWDRIGPILQERIHQQSPEARINTPLNPPNRKYF